MKSGLNFFIALLFCISSSTLNIEAKADEKPPVIIGLSAEFSLKNSSSAQAIEKGILLAIDEVNSAGGVLDGRPLKLITRDDKGLPARAEDNFNAFADDENVIGVFSGRFSPASLSMASIARERKVLLLVPWSAADTVTQQEFPNYVFRVSITDSWAMQVMLDHAQKRGFNKLAFIVPNTAWGRSCEQAFIAYQQRVRSFPYQVIKYNLGKSDFRHKIKAAKDAGAQAIILVAIENEAASVVQQLATFPAEERIPVISHWGVLGGDFAKLAGEALNTVDFTFVTTFSFANKRQRVQKVRAGVNRLFKEDAYLMPAQPGFAHAYDLTHMLAIAINQARTTQRDKVRSALERIDTYHGLVRTYHKPFSSDDHEGLVKQQVYLGRFGRSGQMQIVNGN